MNLNEDFGRFCPVGLIAAPLTSRRGWRRWGAGLLVSGLALGVLLGPASPEARAQTPDAISSAVTAAELAKECIITPRTAAELNALPGPAASPGPWMVLPTATMALSDVLAMGEPVDRDTVERVTAAVDQLLPCFFTGDANRYFALFSDDFLRRTYPGVSFTNNGAPWPTSIPDPMLDQLTVPARPYTVLTVRRLPDDRLAVRAASASGEQVFTFVDEGGQFRVDDVATVRDDATPIAGSR